MVGIVALQLLQHADGGGHKTRLLLDQLLVRHKGRPGSIHRFFITRRLTSGCGRFEHPCAILKTLQTIIARGEMRLALAQRSQILFRVGCLNRFLQRDHGFLKQLVRFRRFSSFCQLLSLNPVEIESCRIIKFDLILFQQSTNRSALAQFDQNQRCRACPIPASRAWVFVLQQTRRAPG